MSLLHEMNAGFTLENAEELRAAYKAARWPSDPTRKRWDPDVVDRAVDDLILLREAKWQCTAIVPHRLRPSEKHRCAVMGSEISVYSGKVLCPRHGQEQLDRGFIVGPGGMISYEAVQAAVQEGPVSARMFAGTEGQQQWALLDGFDADEHTGSTKRIYKVRIHRVLPDDVEFSVEDVEGYRRLPADELARCIEAS